jgi:hypothetical protein
VTRRATVAAASNAATTTAVQIVEYPVTGRKAAAPAARLMPVFAPIVLPMVGVLSLLA